MVIAYRAQVQRLAEEITALRGRDYLEVRRTSGHEKDDMLHNLYNTMFDYLRAVGSTLIPPELKALVSTTLHDSGGVYLVARHHWLYFDY
jgi:hypothetical protein